MNRSLAALMSIIVAAGMAMCPAASCAAPEIKPAGVIVARDEQGAAIYQLSANGIKIGYKLIGQGAPLVLLQGLGLTMADWPPRVITALAKKHQLIIPDNRGMGFTSADREAFTYPLFADDVVALLDALSVKKTDVLGFSMGSTITQQLLLSYPDRVNKAILHGASSNGADVLKALQGRLPNDPIIARQVEATAGWKTPLERLAASNQPVLLIVGTADSTVGTESSKVLATTIPGAWLIQIPNATHHLMHEVPDLFSGLVLQFLESSDPIQTQAAGM